MQMFCDDPLVSPLNALGNLLTITFQLESCELVRFLAKTCPTRQELLAVWMLDDAPDDGSLPHQHPS